jgi:hypothetical protein
MTRSSIHQAIDFQGLIEGCADHQWLLTDALYHSGEEPPDDDTSRWIIRSELIDDGQGDPQFQNRFVARDRKAGWTLSAPSASDLAECIQQKCSDSPSPPSFSP